MTNEPIRAVIAEDEPLAREALAELVSKAEGFSLVATFGDGRTALQGIDALRPDVVFLDIRMPELSGLQVVERMRCNPLVVFTTAFDQHAVAAFELGAVDYVLKPYDLERFGKAAIRIRGIVGGRGRDRESAKSPDLAERLRALLDRDSPVQRIFVRDGERIVPLETEAITHVAADGDYCTVHVGDRAFMIGAAIGTMEKLLEGLRFLRIHRAHLINLGMIHGMVPYDERRLEVRLVGGTRIIASRAGTKRLRELVL